MTITHSGGWYKYECYTPLKLRTALRPQEQTFKAIREQELLAFDVQSNNETLEGLCATLFAALGPVAASKFLYFPAPALLPMWDSKLRQAAGYKNSAAGYIAYMTLVERQSRFVIIVKVAYKRSDIVVAALIKAVRKLPIALRRSLTWDRGAELANHAQFTVATDVQVYFCDPSSPWQRGSNENTNGLLRQYYPKGADLSGVSQAQLDTVARKLNTRPRETLHWKTPAYMLGTSVSMIH